MRVAKQSKGKTSALLDARKGRLVSIGAMPAGIDALLAGEAAAFEAMYKAI